jgi:hypothetical protein
LLIGANTGPPDRAAVAAIELFFELNTLRPKSDATGVASSHASILSDQRRREKVLKVEGRLRNGEFVRSKEVTRKK